MTKNKEELRIVFLGTPEFALPSLSMLLDEGYHIAAVCTQPDRPRGRGHKLAPPPVKVLAEEKGIPVYQFEKISREGLETLGELRPDLLITVAFGQILSRDVLALPPIDVYKRQTQDVPLLCSAENRGVSNANPQEHAKPRRRPRFAA